MAAGQHNLEEGDYSLFFWVAEYPSEEWYLRVLWSNLARFNNIKVRIISRPY